jgi:hypothetical protein
MSLAETTRNISHLDDDQRDCIENCQEAAGICEWCAEECLGDPEMEECTRLCRDLTSLHAHLMARNSRFSKNLGAICADACEACADECEQHDAEHCQVCAATSSGSVPRAAGRRRGPDTAWRSGRRSDGCSLLGGGCSSRNPFWHRRTGPRAGRFRTTGRIRLGAGSSYRRPDRAVRERVSALAQSWSATVITGTGAERTVFSATLPSRIRSVPRFPVVPIPTRWTSLASIVSRMTSTGLPRST